MGITGRKPKMERLVSFKDEELFNQLQQIYNSTYQTAWRLTLLHVHTEGVNNPYHYTSAIESINNSITDLNNFFPEHDKRSFELIDPDKLIEEAKRFFKEDID